jgi:hypothetical protein
MPPSPSARTSGPACAGGGLVERCQNGSDILLNLDEVRQSHLPLLPRFHDPPEVLLQDLLPLPDDQFHKDGRHFRISLFVAMTNPCEDESLCNRHYLQVNICSEVMGQDRPININKKCFIAAST